MSVLAKGRTELVAALAGLAEPVCLVPTMGALHAGHAANINAARAAGGSVVVSIFLNPMQFERAADLARYPRALNDDVALCESLGVDVIWAPQVNDVYPEGPVQVSVSAGLGGTQLEGASRPGHFDGVLTVVNKLFGLIRPEVAFFGEKDYQQLVLVRQMVADLELGVAVRGVPTVREPDGLAMSSRNVFLSPGERAASVLLSAALAQAAEHRTADEVLGAAWAVLGRSPLVQVDYLQLRNLRLGAAPEIGEARLLVAANVGSTRLIDNCQIQLTGSAG